LIAKKQSLGRVDEFSPPALFYLPDKSRERHRLSETEELLVPCQSLSQFGHNQTWLHNFNAKSLQTPLSDHATPECYPQRNYPKMPDD
jgi:hypothetical protein